MLKKYAYAVYLVHSRSTLMQAGQVTQSFSLNEIH